MPTTRLSDVQQLLARHADAVRSGDAEALPGLAEQLRAQLAGLLRERADSDAGERTALAELQQLCVRTQVMLARRAQDAEAALQALAAGAAPAREQQAQRVYAPEGRLAAGAWRGRGLGSA